MEQVQKNLILKFNHKNLKNSIQRAAVNYLWAKDQRLPASYQSFINITAYKLRDFFDSVKGY